MVYDQNEVEKFIYIDTVNLKTVQYYMAMFLTLLFCFYAVYKFLETSPQRFYKYEDYQHEN